MCEGWPSRDRINLGLDELRRHAEELTAGERAVMKGILDEIDALLSARFTPFLTYRCGRCGGPAVMEELAAGGPMRVRCAARCAGERT